MSVNEHNIAKTERILDFEVSRFRKFLPQVRSLSKFFREFIKFRLSNHEKNNESPK